MGEMCVGDGATNVYFRLEYAGDVSMLEAGLIVPALAQGNTVLGRVRYPGS